MKIENKQLRDFLLDTDIVKKDSLEKFFKDAEKNGKALGDLLLDNKLIDENELRKLYSYILGIPFVDLSKDIISSDVLQIIPEPIAKKYNIVAFEKKGNELKVAMLNPEDIQTIDFIRKKTGLKIIPCLATQESIKSVIRQYEKSLKAEFGDIIDKNAERMTVENQEDGEGIGEDLEKMAQGLPVIRVVDTLLKHAILQSASDIHIEPDEKEVIVRYRIDGILHDAMVLPKQVLPGIVARIKVLSNLKLDEHRLPQDGRFKIIKDEYKISFRVSILPVFDGEKIVMRLLDESSKGLTLEKMGLQGRPLEIIHREIKKPNGMILVTGPTGSGKTTTLYTIMDIINTPGVNISTVEDPVEYRMPRVNQTQVNPKIGLTFAACLRALLRQDPDIIMVGEIRDKETAEVAVNAALTGHLVFSTLHTNNAAGTIPRLIDLGVNPKVLGSALTISIAQRLVRTLCSECRQEAIISGDEAELIKKVLAQIHERRPELALPPANRYYKPGSCASCGETGYRGRVGIFEALMVDAAITEATVKNPSEREITVAALPQHILSMREDGIIKVLRGETSIEELGRVIDLHAEFV